MNKRNRKKMLLITGGTGFVGSILALTLGGENRVVCVSRSKPRAQFKKLFHKTVSFAKADISNPKSMERHVRSADCIIHLAGGGGNSACMSNPEWALDTHVRGTRALVKLAEKHKIEKFIFASSYQVYGSPKGRSASVKETDKRAPQNFYASLKTVAEDIVAHSSLNYAIIRFSNVYGYTPAYPLPEAGAINNFIRACLEEKNMHIQGTGKQTSDYVHIQDAVRAIIAVLEKGKRESIYNIGSGRTVTVSELAKKVQNACKSLYKKNTRILKTGDAAVPGGSVRMSIKKAHTKLGWRPMVGLEVGIKEMMLKHKPE